MGWAHFGVPFQDGHGLKALKTPCYDGSWFTFKRSCSNHPRWPSLFGEKGSNSICPICLFIALLNKVQSENLRSMIWKLAYNFELESDSVFSSLIFHGSAFTYFVTPNLVFEAPTFYKHHFCMKVSCEAFLCLHLRFFLLFWRKNIGKNALTKCWWNWPQVPHFLVCEQASSLRFDLSKKLSENILPKLLKSLSALRSKCFCTFQLFFNVLQNLLLKYWTSFSVLWV
jgi:hypothetical protein